MSEVRALVLASQSPRRREILAQLRIPFEVDPGHIEEVRRVAESPEEYVSRLAREKALAVSARWPTRVVLGADTVVVRAEHVLEKPAGDSVIERRANAAAMLLSLSGCSHAVLTGVALVRDAQVLRECVARTSVEFGTISEEVAACYAATGEGDDKAGAYAVQGAAAGFVKALHGSYSNVVGLPAADVLEMLAAVGIFPKWT